MMKKLAKALTAIVCLAGLGMSGCAQPEQSSTPTQMPSPTKTATQPELKEFYEQKLAWKECGDAFDCANLEVPIDYDHPEGKRAKIALKRLTTNNSEKLGTLVMNPGGPGGSGVDAMVSENVGYFFTRKVRENYDVLSFDPRGVQHSNPTIKCRSAKELDQDNSRYTDLNTPEGRAKNIAEVRELGQKCLKNSPDMVKFASTENTARDLDILRAALGDERLNYLGYSYGTYLGAIYADMFPKRVGRFILDGVLDPADNINEVSAIQAEGFENSFREFSRLCQEQHIQECPLSGGTEAGLQQIRTLLDSLIDSPMPTKDPNRPLTVQLATTGLIGPAYLESLWFTQLMPAIAQAMNEGDGTALLNLADTYNSRNPDGTYKDNQSDAFMVINFLDYHPVGDEATWEADAKKLQEKNPTLGYFFTFASLGLDQWPVKPDTHAKREVNPDLDEDILLVGTTGDPATPLQMAQSLHRQMKHSRLLTVQGWNHTSYNSYAASCVRKIGDNYLLTGKIPENKQQGICTLS